MAMQYLLLLLLLHRIHRHQMHFILLPGSRYHTKLNYKRDNIKRHSVAKVIRSHIYPAKNFSTMEWNGIKYQCHHHHSSVSCVSSYRRKKEKADERTGDSKYKGKREKSNASIQLTSTFQFSLTEILLPTTQLSLYPFLMYFASQHV